MPDLFARLISIKLILEEMEQDLGLEALSEVEKNVYLAAQALKSNIGRVETKQIQAHSFTQNMSRPTFFRALKSIEAKGFISRADSKKVGVFEVMEG